MSGTEELDVIWDSVKDVTFNGPHEAGVAAGLERVKIDSECLWVSKGVGKAAGSAYAIVGSKGSSFSRLRETVIAAAGLIEANHWWDETSHVVTDKTIARTELADLSETIKGIKDEDSQRACTLLGAMKVNFYQSNHHVGQKEFSGYLLKVVRVFWPNAKPSGSDLYEILWIMGHWASTKGVLASIGVVGIEKPLDFKNFPKPADDLLVRASGFPAGTAKIGVVCAILRRIATGAFARTIPVTVDCSAVFLAEMKVKANSAAYHIGAYHLTGRPRMLDATVGEDLLELCSAYVHATNPKGTLAAAKVLPGLEVIKDHIVYVTLSALVKEIAANGFDMSDAKAKVMGTHENSEDFATAVKVADAVARDSELGKAWELARVSREARMGVHGEEASHSIGSTPASSSPSGEGVVRHIASSFEAGKSTKQGKKQ